MYSYIERALNDGLSVAKENDDMDNIIMYQAALLELKDIIIKQQLLSTPTYPLTRQAEEGWRNYIRQQGSSGSMDRVSNPS